MNIQPLYMQSSPSLLIKFFHSPEVLFYGEIEDRFFSCSLYHIIRRRGGTPTILNGSSRTRECVTQ